MPPVPQEPSGNDAFVALVVLAGIGLVCLFLWWASRHDAPPPPPTNYEALQKSRFKQNRRENTRWDK